MGRADSRWSLLALWAAAGLLLLPLLLRLWTLTTLAHDIRIAEPVLDAGYYFNLAKSIVALGHWPEDPLFFGPFYPWLLSVLFHLGPPTPLTVQIFQSILGVAALGLLFLAVRRSFGRMAAYGAAALYVLSGPILAMENLILMESVLFFFAALALYLWPDGQRRLSTNIFFGLTCGILAAARATFLLLPILALTSLVLGMRQRTSADARRITHPATAQGAKRTGRSTQPSLARPIVIIMLGVIFPLVPQTIHQTRATGHLAVFTLNSGMNLYIGNNPQARGISSAPPGLDLNEDVTGRRSASNLAGRALTLEESSRLWRERSFAFMRENPGRALWLFVRKALLFLSPAEIPQVYNFDTLKEDAKPLSVAFSDFAWVLPLAIAGVVYARRGLDHGKLTPWLALIATGWIQTIIFFATGRYRIAVMPGFFGLAGLGMAGIVADLKSVRAAGAHGKQRAFMVAAGVAVAIVIMHLIPPGYPVAKARAFDAYFVGQRYQQRGNVERALAEYRAAARVAPEFGEAWHGTGAILYGQGAYAEAAQAFEAALQRIPASAITYYALGVTYFQLQEFDRAVAVLEAATRLNPRRPDYRFDFGTALARAGRMDEARSQWQITLQLDPQHEGARMNLQRLANP